MLRILIGLIVPFIGIVVLLPWVNGVKWAPLNLPFLYWWMFLWFIISTVCLLVCWFGFDAHRDNDAEEGNG